MADIQLVGGGLFQFEFGVPGEDAMRQIAIFSIAWREGDEGVVRWETRVCYSKEHLREMMRDRARVFEETGTTDVWVAEIEGLDQLPDGHQHPAPLTLMGHPAALMWSMTCVMVEKSAALVAMTCSTPKWSNATPGEQ